MRFSMLAAALFGIAALTVNAPVALALTCADQHRACLSRGHHQKECRVSTDRCLKTGRWIGPAGREFPITSRK